MKIAVVAANGKASRAIIEELIARGHAVMAFARSENKSATKDFVQKDILGLTKDDLAGFDAVMDGFGAYTPETLPLHTKTSQHLADLVAGTNTRLYIVGGAGSLYVDPAHTVQLLDTPEFPAEFYPIAKAQAEELAALRSRTDAQWVFVSPAADFRADGEKTGKYILGGEELTLSAAGESVISYADYALGMVDLIESGAHVGERVSLVRA
ncbi:NAD(P)H-binding protein [uncultured Selenomonas sp.]|uniref:NAD(P)-dependent oxidoreductase n=1 Tax=uncultured Selenomonas sp. TaxID=159275 RepID=UPI0028E64736|nr:NAD(P)H-binding protein [uncultured Selenomonas sp.]